MRRILSFAASTHLAVVLMAAVAAYLSAASVAPAQLAAWLGAPAEALYRHWVLIALGTALCVNVLAATLLRIPLDWPRAGAWCSHAGVLVLAAGVLWYALGSVRGQCAAVRLADGWSEIQFFSVDRTAAVYVSSGGDDAGRHAVPTPLDVSVESQGPPRAMDVAVQVAPAKAELRVREFRPAAVLAWQWENDSPRDVPAAELRLEDAGQAGEVMLCPAYEDAASFDGPDYTLLYHPGTTPRMLEKLTAGGEGPGMRHDVALIAAGKDVVPTVVVIHPDGKRWKAAMKEGQAVDVPLAGRKVRLTLLRLLPHAARWATLEEESPEDHAGAADGGAQHEREHEHEHEHQAVPAVRVDIRAGQWQRSAWLPFSPIADLAQMQRVDLPGGETLELSFSRLSRPLPQTVKILDAKYETYPGSYVPRDYRCELQIDAGGEVRRETLSLNHPLHVGPYQLSQSSWLPSPLEPRQIILGVASRPGLPVIWAGCILIVLGLPYAFYVKPLILRRRQRP